MGLQSSRLTYSTPALMRPAEPHAWPTRLAALLSKPMLLVYGLEQIAQNPTQAATLFPNSGFNLSKLPVGADIFTLLKRLPEDQRLALGVSLDERFAALGGEKALLQAAPRAALAEYEALGMDAVAIQNAYILRVGGQMLLIALLAAVATITVGLLGSQIAAGLARNLRRVLFEKVMRFSGAEFEHFSTARTKPAAR